MRYFLIVILSFVLQIVYSQNAKTGIIAPQEDIFLHTDRDLYITGEKIWFKAYCLENKKLKSEFSKVLYLELFDDEKNVFIQNKFKISDGTANGAIEIPSNINSGNYFLRAYTKYQRNFPVEHHYTQVVSIVNPNGEEKKIKLSENKIAHKIDNKNSEINPIILEIIPNKTKYKQREIIKFSLKAMNESSSNLSISVRQKGSAHNQKSLIDFAEKNPWLNYSLLFESIQFEGISFFNRKKNIIKNLNQLKWVPEFRSSSLSGIIRNKLTKAPITDVACLTSVISKIPQVHLFETEIDGSFNFSYPNLIKDEKIYIGIFQSQFKKDLEILVYNDFNTEFAQVQKTPLLFNEDLNSMFESIFINHQLNRNFKIDNLKKVSLNYNRTHSPFNLGKPGLVVDTKEYIDLPYLEDIFREIIPGVFVYNSKGKKRLSIHSKRDDLLYRNPLVLLDNVPVTDIDKLLLIEPLDINIIEVYNSRYFLGNHFMNGIISIKTKTDNFASYKWTDNSVFVQFKAITEPEIFEYPDYSKYQVNPKPDFRTTLYWNPNFSSKVLENLEFYSSDRTAIYEIIVKGFTTDGIPCFGKAEFEVTK